MKWLGVWINYPVGVDQRQWDQATDLITPLARKHCDAMSPRKPFQVNSLLEPTAPDRITARFSEKPPQAVSDIVGTVLDKLFGTHYNITLVVLETDEPIEYECCRAAIAA